MKGQVGYLDFVIAVVIFTLVFIMVYKYIPNVQDQELNNINDQYMDAQTIAGGLMSRGSPENWDEGNVMRIGLANSEYVLDKQKTNSFGNLSNLNYVLTKSTLLDSKSDFIVFFQDTSGRPRRVGSYYSIGSSDVSWSTDAASYRVAYYASPASGLHGQMSTLETNTGVDVQSYNNPATLIAQIDDFNAALIEQGEFNAGDIAQLEDYVSEGHTIFLSGDVMSAPGTALNVTFLQGSASSFNCSVLRTDSLLDFQADEAIEFGFNATVRNSSTPYYRSIAEYEGNPSVARWKFGNGTIYYFSSFDANYTGEYGSYQQNVEEALEQHLFDNIINATLDFSGIDADNLVKLNRLLLYSNQPIVMVVYAWR